MRVQRRRRGRDKVDSTARNRAKALLRQAGEAIERGDRAAGAKLLEAALEEDPTFVEPPLVLARLRDEEGEDAISDALVEEAVRRGNAAIERLGLRPTEQPRWWRDEATRPYMKALVARGWRLLERDEPEQAAEQFGKVFAMEPDEDPLAAGVYAAEACLFANQPEAALERYSQVAESPDVCYGRAVALFATNQLRAGFVSLWLGALLNTHVAQALVGDGATGLDPSSHFGDPGEADDILGRLGELFDGDDRRRVLELLSHESFHRDAASWALLARALDDADTTHRERELLDEIETFLDEGRIGGEVDKLLAARPKAPQRLPTVH